MKSIENCAVAFVALTIAIKLWMLPMKTFGEISLEECVGVGVVMLLVRSVSK